jgi:hypothetical protein
VGIISYLCLALQETFLILDENMLGVLGAPECRIGIVENQGNDEGLVGKTFWAARFFFDNHSHHRKNKIQYRFTGQNLNRLRRRIIPLAQRFI